MTEANINVIVQAGGRGSRLRHHTWNKPKCLVSVRGKPLLYHLFDRFRSAKFWIIGDYAYEQLEKYLELNLPSIQFHLLRTHDKGTSSGIAQALREIPSDQSLLLTWSDLIIGDLPEFPDVDMPIICITSAFTCRWILNDDGQLVETPSSNQGIPGLFYFPQARLLPTPPLEGEFVKWFSVNIKKFTTLNCPNLQELGDFADIESINDRAGFCRFFNHIEMGENIVTKTVVDSAFVELNKREIEWYHQASKLGFRRIPKIYSTDPLTMERVHGDHLYNMNDLTTREKRAVISDYLDALISLHDKASSVQVAQDVDDVYRIKTIKRVESIASIIPGFKRASISVNGIKCRNPFTEKYNNLISELLRVLQPEIFTPIHGDATFSNTLVDKNLRVWFIDPRGYFSTPGIMGDPWYDFAKVYYSAVGGYDAFNRRKFKLYVDDETIEVLMEEPLLAKIAPDIFREFFGDDLARIEILHGLIWLSLSGYAKDDIDSAIGSFFLGLYWLERGTQKL